MIAILFVILFIATHSMWIGQNTPTQQYTLKKLHRIVQIDAIKTILEQAPDILPIACGGGGIPVSRIPSNPQTLTGVEAVIDKDACGAKLAVELDADGFIILTDGGGIWQNFGKPNAREMKKASPGEWA